MHPDLRPDADKAVMLWGRLAWAAIVAFLLGSMALAGCRLLFEAFDADELQHAHIAWLIASGKVLYRDFWDNHGPVFAPVNGTLLALADARPDVSLILWCRAGAATAAMAMLALTYRLARLLALTPRVAATAAAILASLIIMQDKGTECRPDGLQNVFWLAGLCLLVAQPRRGRLGVRLAAGALFGLAVLTNMKAALGPFFVLVSYVAGRMLPRVDAGIRPGDLLAMLAGATVVYLGFLPYFVLHDAVGDFHFFNIVFNLLFVGADSTGRGLAVLKFMLAEQLPFVVFTAIGIALWVADLLKPQGTLARPAGWLIAFVAIGFAFGWLLNNYRQFYLIALPAWSIAAAFGLWSLGERLTRWRSVAGRWAGATLAVASASALGVAAARETPLAETELLKFQRFLTTALVQGTRRSEPIGVIWDICGGYMFNAPVQRYWAVDPSVGAVVARYSGSNPFGAGYLAALERQQVRFVTGRDNVMLRELPAETQRYLREHFTYSNCLWTRRQDPAP